MSTKSRGGSAGGPRGTRASKNIKLQESESFTINPSIHRPTTPLRRTSSAGPPSGHHSTRRTPAAQMRTPGAITKAAWSGRRGVAVTPHGRAAQRELEIRRAGLTPGKGRRRSGRQQRETPRDTLRALSRLLAPKTRPVVSSSPPPPRRSTGNFNFQEQDDLDDEPELERPRLSLPMGDEDEDDDDSLLLPPQSAGLEDEDFTVQSVEFARRAVSEQPWRSRLSMGSFGSIRMSDRFADLNSLGRGEYGEEGYDSSYIGQAEFGDDFQAMPDMTGHLGDNTETLRDLGLDRATMPFTSGRESDIRPGMLAGDDTETTFAFNIPPRDIPEQYFNKEESPLASPSRVDDDPPEMEEVAGEEGQDVEEPASPGEQLRHEILDSSLFDSTLQTYDIRSNLGHKVTRKNKNKLSKHGIPYPSLPIGVVKKLATTYARMGGNSKAKINKETLDAIMQASDWFFEQVSDDLGAYAKHAGRKTIDESDVVTLMARQRQTNSTTTPFSLAQNHLPRELLQELRMVPPLKLKKGRPLEMVEEEE